MYTLETSHKYLSKNVDDLLLKIGMYYHEYKDKNNKEVMNILGDIYNSLMNIYMKDKEPKCSAENNDNINY